MIDSSRKVRRTAVITGRVLLILLLAGNPALAQDVPPPPQDNPDGPVEIIDTLALEIDFLLQANSLRSNDHRRLQSALSKAKNLLFAAEPGDAAGAMDRFEGIVTIFVNQGQLDPKSSIVLVDLGRQVRDAALALQMPPLPPLDCVGQFMVFYVDAFAAAGGDGSAGAPYRRITEALTAAAGAGTPAVEIRLATAWYEEHLAITRDTRIRPLTPNPLVAPLLAGSIQNHGAHCLEIKSLSITDPGAGPAGGIYVAHPLAQTLIHDAFIFDARGYGIVQHGGLLRLATSTIYRTTPLAEPVGVALHLSDSVQGLLQNVVLADNSGGGLVVRDAGTEVRAENLEIANTTLNWYSWYPADWSAERQIELIDARLIPEIEPDYVTTRGRAALHVDSNALFTGTVVNLSDNEYAGIYVENGAEARFAYTNVSNTREWPRLGNQGAGINVWSKSGGQIAMSYFVSEDADLCGISIGLGGVIGLSQGEVRRNPIGACIHDPVFDRNRLLDRVSYTDNGAIFETVRAPARPAPSSPGL